MSHVGPTYISKCQHSSHFMSTLYKIPNSHIMMYSFSNYALSVNPMKRWWAMCGHQTPHCIVLNVSSLHHRRMSISENIKQGVFDSGDSRQQIVLSSRALINYATHFNWSIFNGGTLSAHEFEAGPRSTSPRRGHRHHTHTIDGFLFLKVWGKKIVSVEPPYSETLIR